MARVPEFVVNVKLAEILDGDLGVDARAERVTGGRRPDIRCYFRGLVVGIEASYSRSDAERDAAARVEQELVDVALALWIKESFGDLPEGRLREAVRGSRFDVKVFVPRDLGGTLLPYLQEGARVRAEATTGWLRDVDLPTLKTIIEHTADFLAEERETQGLIGEVKRRIEDFAASLAALDVKGTVRRRIYEILYQLYGLSIASPQDPDIVFGQAALSILLSSTLYENVRGAYPELQPLTAYTRKYGHIEGLRRALEDLLKVDYRAAVETTLEILGALPREAERRVASLVDLAARIAGKRILLKRDFAGRVYHEITGDMALRKGFATFYTEVPAAYLLASLAAESVLGLDDRSITGLEAGEARRIIERIGRVKVGDLACGSGTLLTASYSVFYRIAASLKYYYGLEDVDLESLGRRLIEEGIYGVDALKYASQITAINLALIGPGAIARENVYTIYLGYLHDTKQAWLGSLELLNEPRSVGGLLAWIEGGLRGAVERASLEGFKEATELPERFDLVIMNPPFTRATGRSEQFRGERGLFGFIAGEDTRAKLLKAYNRVRDRVRGELRQIAEDLGPSLPGVFRDIIAGRLGELRQLLDIGQAGEGLLFLYLAYRYVGVGGVIAFVLPRGLLAGSTWFLARTLLASRFHVKYVIVSSDAERGYNFSERASLSETLIVARRVEKHSSDNETVFVNLLRKPSTALEALMLAEELKRASRGLRVNEWRVVEVGGSSALVLKVSRRQLLENIDNWNRFVAVPDPELVRLFSNGLLENGVIELRG